MSLARDITTVGSGTLVSRLLGFARDAAIAALLGAGPISEAFFAVVQVINFFRRLLAEGALNAAFVPIWLRLREGGNGQANADRFTRRNLLAMFCVTGIVALLAIVFAYDIIGAIVPGFDDMRRTLAAFYLIIAAPYIVLAGLVAIIAAALNAEGRVIAVTTATILFNVVLVIVLVAMIAARTDDVTASIVLTSAIVLAGVIQLAVIAAAWLLAGKRWQRITRRVPDQTRPFFLRTVPGLVAAGIPQLKLIAGAAIASSSQAGVAWLYYANRLYELPLGVASIAIAAVIVPRIAASLRASDNAAFAGVQSRAYEIALGLALPAAAGFALLAQPIAGGLFERGAFGPGDTLAVAAALAAICAGLPGHALEKVFGAVSFAHDDTHTPMIAALCGLAAAVIGGLLLFPHYGHVGVAAAIAISGWVGASVLGLILAARGWLHLDAQATQRLPRIVIATAVMAAIVVCALIGAHRVLLAPASSFGRLVLLCVLVSLGVAAYLTALQVLGVARLKDLVTAVRHKV
jgi:putative peptidoglycan lipid II flippase